MDDFYQPHSGSEEPPLSQKWERGTQKQSSIFGKKENLLSFSRISGREWPEGPREAGEERGKKQRNTQETGSIGEGIAACYLASSGYDVRERNVRFKKLEIDIIAYDRAEKMMVFVEVKTRKSHSSEYPIHAAVGARKRKNMRRAVSKWMATHEYQGLARIDVISVCDRTVVEHIRDLGSDFY